MLVHTWLEAEQKVHGLNEQEARHLLNLSLGTKYRHGNTWNWKDGTSPAKDVRHYMLRRCLGWYLEHEMPKLSMDIESDIETAVMALL
jgi:hypothetical protein